MPSLNLEGGVEQPAPAGPTVLTFDNQDYGYVIRLGAKAAELGVNLGGAPIQSEPLIGYAYVPR